MHLLIDPVAVQTDHNLASWNSVVKVFMQLVDEASQFTVGGHIVRSSTAAEFPPTIFGTVVMHTLHSSDHLVSRAVEVNRLPVVIHKWCNLAVWALCTSICSTYEVEFSISMEWTVWALNLLDSLWVITMALYRCIKIIVLIRKGFLSIWKLKWIWSKSQHNLVTYLLQTHHWRKLLQIVQCTR